MYDENALVDHPLTPTEINTLISQTLKEGFYNLSVTGEIAQFTQSATGHWYFTLKDSKSRLSMVMFKSAQYRMEFHPKPGDQITATGSIEVYVPSGSYQLICQRMMRSGDGDAALAMEKRRAYYESLGYFDPAKKRPIPSYPKTVGIITADTGAAIRDILQITGRRAPAMHIIILPTLVQGNQAAAMIAGRIKQANEFLLADVLIIGRGGGNSEDLLPFSDPLVIEAMHESVIPTISAVGHERDWSLSDYIADMRASTPSAAAELVTTSYFEQRQGFFTKIENIRSAFRSLYLYKKGLLIDSAQLKTSIEERIHRAYLFIDSQEMVGKTALETKLQAAKARFGASCSLLCGALPERSAKMRMRFENAWHVASLTMKGKQESGKTRFKSLSNEIEALSPLSILNRGYAILLDKDGKAVKNAKKISVGTLLEARLAKGTLLVEAKGEKENEL